MHVSIDYPLPDTTVGRVFHVGGTYDAQSHILRGGGTAAAAGAVAATATTATKPKIIEYKVLCKLFLSMDGPVVEMTDSNASPVGPWDVAFDVDADYDNCKITAQLFIDDQDTEQTDEVTGIKIKNGRGGTVRVS